MATIVNGVFRKPPRILRKTAIPKKAGTSFEDDNGGDDLRTHAFEVRDGILAVNPRGLDHTSGPVYNNYYREKPLPGVADEVESYPCRFCHERVFLTGPGLEKHGREMHVKCIDEILEDIKNISIEWKKREFERSRMRDMSQMERLRQEARATQMIRAIINGEDIDSLDGEAGNERYEACGICNVLINIAHPTAMDSHQRAHKKNDELRHQMLDQFGPEVVRRLTCESCSLVFTEDRKLQLHMTTHHSRKKTYICKYCGKISQSLTELNFHKSDVHNYHSSLLRASTREMMHMQKRRYEVMAKEVNMESKRRRVENYRESSETQSQIGQITEGDRPCRTFCPMCGLRIERPAMLAKHMLRVHSTSTFSAVFETGGMPSFEVDVDHSQVTFICCDIKFHDRAEFVEHRRAVHLPDVSGVSLPIDTSHTVHMDGEMNMNDETITTNFEGELVQAPDGSMQVILPEGVELNGEVFVMIDPNEPYDGKQSTKVQVVQTNPRMGNEQMMNDVEEQEQEDEDQLHEIIQDDGECLTLTEEQYQQLQMQVGDNWSNMEIMLVNGEEMVDEMGQSVKREQHYADVIDGGEVEIGAEVDAEINGTPLFD